MLEKPTLENPMQLNKDIQKTDLPTKEKINTDLQSTHSIPILSPTPSPSDGEAAAPPERKRKETETQSAYEIYREIIKDNISYDILMQDMKFDGDRLDEIVDIMQSILDAITEWIKEILIGAINGNLSTMFGDVNEKVGTIAAEVGQTPQGWNAGIFNMIRTLSENVIVPIAGLVITYVLCVELISMVTEKNNMHDVDTFMFFKWFFKAWVAVYLVTHTFDITMAVFDVAQHVVSGAAGVISGSTNIDVAAALASMQSGLDAMEIPELLLLVMETSLVSLCMKIMSVLITVILYGRMIEIYLYCSVSPIPFATMTNREWGQIGNNYLKSLFAIGFQGFLIMICVGIYAVLVNSMIVADNLHSAIFSLAAYTVILCFSLFKSGALAKSIFAAH